MAKHSFSGQDADTDNTLVLDVGGKRFRTSLDTLRKLPKSKLGRLALEDTEDAPGKPREVFFDRNPKIMNSVLDFYRTGELHLPSNVCCRVVEEELRFWGVPLELIRDCCWKDFEYRRNERHVTSDLQKCLQEPYHDFVVKQPMSWRMKIWCLLERPADSVVSKIWQVIFFSFVFLSILSFVLETDRNFRVPTDYFRKFDLEPRNLTLTQAYFHLSPVHFMAVTTPKKWLHTLRCVTFAFFLIDLLLRFITCEAKKMFFKHYRNWLEIAVAVKTAIHFTMEKLIFSEEVDNVSHTMKTVSLLLYALSGVRVLRILYLAKTFPALKIMVLCMGTSKMDLIMMVACVFSFVLLFGTMAFLAEALEGNQTFSSLFEAVWWSVITMTTVGYGDVRPASLGGKVVGSTCAVTGVIVLAMPITVLANNFDTYHSAWQASREKGTRSSFLVKNPGYCANPTLCFGTGSDHQRQERSDRTSYEGGSAKSSHRVGDEESHHPNVQEIGLRDKMTEPEKKKEGHVKRNQVDILIEEKNMQ